jgi:hypothetical protein
MAVNRNLPKNGKILPANKNKLDRILGVSSNWASEVYSDSPQLSFLEDNLKQKGSIDIIQNFILRRLKQTFPTVSEKAVLLKNDRNSPQFLLCFAGSNDSSAARKLSLRAADYILSNM